MDICPWSYLLGPLSTRPSALKKLALESEPRGISEATLAETTEGSALIRWSN